MSIHTSPEVEIPLFPLNVVVFPRGRLALQIFEQRYIELVKRSLRDDEGFGICLLKSGGEVAAPGARQTIHDAGTRVVIRDWDQLDNGLLGITVEGTAKFRVRDCWQGDSGVMQARVSFCDGDHVESESLPPGQEHDALLELLQNLGNHPMVEQQNIAVDYGNLREIGWRLSELLPIEAVRRQQLLELDDPYLRLQEIEKIVSELANNH